jgi:hypothetical protein
MSLKPMLFPAAPGSHAKPLRCFMNSPHTDIRGSKPIFNYHLGNVESHSHVCECLTFPQTFTQYLEIEITKTQSRLEIIYKLFIHIAHCNNEGLEALHNIR